MIPRLLQYLPTVVVSAAVFAWVGSYTLPFVPLKMTRRERITIMVKLFLPLVIGGLTMAWLILQVT